jgi:60 kDa SS-A/Ro ribonucleoprotein
MASKTLFGSLVGKLMPKTNTVNSHGSPAYKLDDKHALAQLAATGCLNATFYASAESQLDTVLQLAGNVEPEFVAKTALYARHRGFMKDMPALLCAILSVTSPGLMAEIFDRVIDNPKMLRNFVQIMRSGTVGRKSLGSLPKKLVTRWLESRTDEQLFRGSVGNDPSLADVIKMVHPKPGTPARQALYGYLIGRDHDVSRLPEIVRQFEAFKKGETKQVPDVPFQMLTALPLGTKEWTEIAKTASWTMTRMNLNTFERHGVLKDSTMVRTIAKRLRERELVKKARAFPYQLLAAFLNVEATMPREITDALQDAMEIAVENVPELDGNVFVFPDVSGSMSGVSITGYRKGATSKVRAIDVAALVAASVLRKNPHAEVIPFEQNVVSLRINGRDAVMTNATKLASIGGGGTNCSAPMALVNSRRTKVDLVIYVSDNESWVDARRHGATETMRQWTQIKARNPDAKMVCIDLAPNTTTQAAERVGDILNIGGFSDSVFDVIATFAKGTLNPNHWVGVIESERI